MSNKFMGLHFHVDRARNYNRRARGAPELRPRRRDAASSSIYSSHSFFALRNVSDNTFLRVRFKTYGDTAVYTQLIFYLIVMTETIIFIEP